MSDTNSAAAAPEADFVLRKPANFWWTVRVPAPQDDDYRLFRLQLQFRAVTQPTLERMQGRGLAEGEAPPSDDDVCRTVVVGWRGLNDEAGQALPFTPENLAAVLAIPMVKPAVVATYMAAMSGVAARKNAPAPPAAG